MISVTENPLIDLGLGLSIVDHSSAVIRGERPLNNILVNQSLQGVTVITASVRNPSVYTLLPLIT